MNEPRDSSVASAPAGERAVPYHCPFCAEEDLRPHGSAPGAWHCRACLRVFSVRFLGIEAIADPPLTVSIPVHRVDGGP